MILYRIQALIERNLIITLRDAQRLVDFFYWPLLDIIIWGFTSKWLQYQQISQSNLTLIVLSSLVLWQVTTRANLEVSFNLLEELWSRNIVNLFSTPLYSNEWTIASLIMGFYKSILVFFFGAFLAWSLCGVTIFSVGWLLIPCFFLLVASGLTIGLFVTSALIYWGQKGQTLVWTVTWIFAPFSGVFYPIAVLPSWAQSIAKALPMTYVFEGLRSFLTTGIVPWHALATSAVLNIIYFVGALLCFRIMFNKSKVKGLARLEVE